MTQSASDIPEIIFFLGAGASVEADIPDTRSFIFGREHSEDCFIGYLKNNGFQKEGDILTKIFSSLDENKRKNTDVELVLQILHELNDRTENHVHHFYEQSTFKFNSQDDVQSLKRIEELLRKFIREKVLANVNKIDYLSPLLSFEKPLIIFSVNYDTCIESLSLKHKLSYTDGFELNWQPDLFDKKYDIKLFKLHGSIIWYQTDSGNYLKLPVTQDKIQLITGEIAQPFLLYPMKSKGQFAESLSFLSTQLQLYLKSAKICVVVGYSFRDEDIRRIFFEMAKNNNSLTILLVSPNAGEIFNKQLRYYDDQRKIPSSLSEKVICWNYCFGPVLNDFHLYRTLQPKISLLKSIYSFAENAKKEENRHESHFKDCIFQAALPLEDTITIEKIFEKELGLKAPNFGSFFNSQERFKILYSLGFLHLFNSDYRYQQYFSAFIDYLKEIKNNGLGYYRLHQKKGHAFENLLTLERKLPIGQYAEQIKEARIFHSSIENEIGRFHREFPKRDFEFYYWPKFDPSFFIEINEFNLFIQQRIKLRYGISEKMDYLINIEKICSFILQINDTIKNYKPNSAFVQFGDLRIDDDKLNKLGNLFDQLIENIEHLTQE